MTSADSRNPAPVQAGSPIPAAHRPPPAWRESASCRRADPELFFPIGTTGKAAAEIQHAKAVCASCPVQQPCLAYALTTCQEFGIWGGCDENERRLLHRRWRQSLIADGSGRSQPLALLFPGVKTPAQPLTGPPARW